MDHLVARASGSSGQLADEHAEGTLASDRRRSVVAEQVGQRPAETLAAKADHQAGDVGFIEADAVGGDEMGEFVQVGVGVEVSDRGHVIRIRKSNDHV